MKYPHLFEPLRLGSTVLRNRIFASATGLSDYSFDGAFSDAAVAYYARKAQGDYRERAEARAPVDAPYALVDQADENAAGGALLQPLPVRQHGYSLSMRTISKNALYIVLSTAL